MLHSGSLNLTNWVHIYIYFNLQPLNSEDMINLYCLPEAKMGNIPKL